LEFDLVVEGEAVLRSGTEHMQVGLRDGIIADLRKTGLRGRKVDASGCLIFPGFIDPHVHLREPGWESKEDFMTASAAAVHGGVTTVFDMPNNPVPATTPEALEKKLTLARRAPIDILFHGGVTRENLHSLARMSNLVVSYKLYLAETTGSLLLPQELLPAALSEISKTGKPASIHCEDQSLIELRKEKAGGAWGPEAHARIRNRRTEVDSVRKVLSARPKGGRGKVNLCHLSTGESCGLVTRARGAGGAIACEATLHHLFFNSEILKEKGDLLRVNPPLRSESDRKALVRALKGGDVDFLVTDHAPHLLEEKMSGDPPSGVPGLDNYGNVVAWLITEQDMSPSRVARATSGNQAGFFGLKDRGELARGKVADIAVVDLKLTERVTAEGLRTKCGWSPYEGIKFRGRVRWTIKDGTVLLDDCQLIS